MKVYNVHERTFSVGADQVGDLLETLASDDDKLWPHEKWPAMRLKGGVTPGSWGGHGPVRYTVGAHEEKRLVVLEFSNPRGFIGHHRYEVEEVSDSETVLRHVIEMRVTGMALITWPLAFWPLHDALMEDSLNKAAINLGQAPEPVRWSLGVRLLRGFFAIFGGKEPDPSRVQ